MSRLFKDFGLKDFDRKQILQNFKKVCVTKGGAAQVDFAGFATVAYRLFKELLERGMMKHPSAITRYENTGSVSVIENQLVWDQIVKALLLEDRPAIQSRL